MQHFSPRQYISAAQVLAGFFGSFIEINLLNIALYFPKVIRAKDFHKRLSMV